MIRFHLLKARNWRIFFVGLASNKACVMSELVYIVFMFLGVFGFKSIDSFQYPSYSLLILSVNYHNHNCSHESKDSKAKSQCKGCN